MKLNIIIALLVLICAYLFWGLITSGVSFVASLVVAIYVLVAKNIESIGAALLGIFFLLPILIRLTTPRKTS